MALSPEQRKAISGHCLPMSWQVLGAWRLRHQGTLTDEADVVVDWLASANHRSQALCEEMLRFMTEKLWRIELRPLAEQDANAAGLRALDVVCSGQRWTLWLQPRPQLHLLRISR